MATTVSFNGTNYSVPAYGDTGWAQGTGNLSSYLIAVASGTLQTVGGTFTLSGNVNFGASFGLLAAYFSTRASNPSTAGLIRLATADTIGWRNFANGANVLLSKDSSDLLKWGSAFIVTSSTGATVTQYRDVYTAGTASGTYTGSLTLVNLSNSYIANGKNLNVFVNGLCQDVTLDYTETSTSSFTFTSALNTGDRISVRWTLY